MNPADLAAAFGKRLDDALAANLCAALKGSVVGASADALDFESGAAVPVVRRIPRFVASDAYADSFSYQWTRYVTTQVDSTQASDLSEDDLVRKTGLAPDQVRGRFVLDAGAGVGRHSEILAKWGAHVVGVDLSAAVEAARDNLARFGNAVVIQADISDLPFREGSFDLIVSMGVLHHTPDTRAHAARLAPLLRSGGDLAIWVYPPEFSRRKEWVPLCSKLPHPAFKEWCDWIVGVAATHPRNPLVAAFMRQFPFSMHHPTMERSVLSLFDGYSPTYHGVHSVDEVLRWFREFGLVNVRTNAIPTSVRGTRP